MSDETMFDFEVQDPPNYFARVIYDKVFLPGVEDDDYVMPPWDEALRDGIGGSDRALEAARAIMSTLGKPVGRIAALEAEAEMLHAAAEDWRVRAEEAEAKMSGPLPCDVRIPGALIATGVKIETLLLAISRREPGTRLPGRTPAVSWDAVANARRQALEEAEEVASAFGHGRPLVERRPKERILGRWEGEQAASGAIAAAIRALADKQAAGGDDD